MEALRIARLATPQRWHRAAERAHNEGVHVCQLQGIGRWIANSSNNGTAAYELLATGNVARDCDCRAGLNGDPVCKHRAAFYLLIGALVLPEPPAPASLVTCPECYGGGVIYDQELEKRYLLYPSCLTCKGSSQIAAQAA